MQIQTFEPRRHGDTEKKNSPCLCVSVVFTFSALVRADPLSSYIFLLPSFQNPHPHLQHHPLLPNANFQLIYLTLQFHFLPGHPLHTPYLSPRSSVRHPLLTFQLSRQITAPRPDRCSLHASHCCRRIKFQRALRQSRLIHFLFPLSSFTFHSHFTHPYRPRLLQHHHRHPHRRQRPLPP